mmetsp:Transcript_15988/g.26213  ORF Transcript_15988/g.26213 Transcript_15988/m.26213 type:complete len:83 (-) Transcript_15988:472-720(-)
MSNSQANIIYSTCNVYYEILKSNHSLLMTKSFNAPNAFFAAGALASFILSCITSEYLRKRSDRVMLGESTLSASRTASRLFN